MAPVQPRASHAIGPAFVAVNSSSLLASKMVKEGFGLAGNDLRIGVDILWRTALADEFPSASGGYFDNESGRFSRTHPAAQDAQQVRAFMQAVSELAGA